MCGYGIGSTTFHQAYCPSRSGFQDPWYWRSVEGGRYDGGVLLWVATVETSRWVSAIPHSHHQISQPDLRNSTSHPNLRVYPISIILRTLLIIPIDSKRLPKPLSEQPRHTINPVFFLLTKRTTLSPPSPVALTATTCSLQRCCPRLALKRIFRALSYMAAPSYGHHPASHPQNYHASPVPVPNAPAGTFQPGTLITVGAHKCTIERYLSEG